VITTAVAVAWFHPAAESNFGADSVTMLQWTMEILELVILLTDTQSKR
jgi:hypothetical protein